MTSLRHRMREKREVLAQLTEAERSALAAIHRLEEETLTAGEAFRSNRKAAERVPTVAFHAAFFGGLRAAALIAAFIYWIR